MLRHSTYVCTSVLLLSSITVGEETKALRIGISKSIFRDVPPALASVAGQPFQDLMKEQTGLTGEIIQDPDPMSMARSIDEGKMQMGVFPGHEFAWAKEKYPSLQPLICSVYRPREIQAVILVRHDCKANNLADLKGMRLALASTLKDHARLFLERKRAEDMDGGNFCSTEKTATVHDGIHKLLESEVDVTVADHADWSYFEKLYPGPAKNLKVLARSEEFPPTVLVFKKGAIPDFVLEKVRDGFLTAHENAKAAKIMKIIRIDRFSAIPDSYDESLRECRKCYPKPLASR